MKTQLSLATDTFVCTFLATLVGCLVLSSEAHGDQSLVGAHRMISNTGRTTHKKARRMDLAQSIFLASEAVQFASVHLANEMSENSSRVPLDVLHASGTSFADNNVKTLFAEELNWIMSKRQNNTVCCPGLGCFRRSTKLVHPIGLPDAPEFINTFFWLYSRINLGCPQLLDYRTVSGFRLLKQFATPKDLVILIHGFGQHSQKPWVTEVKDALLRQVDCNVLVVDWRKGARKPHYLAAVANTAMVARQLFVLVRNLKRKFPDTMTPSRLHLVGFSIGAHVAGFFGRYFKKRTGELIGRITALDATGPLFEGTSVHVSRKDAEFVDVIHTSGGSSILEGELGTDRPFGHVDFYPNGGRRQPGCPSVSGVTCHHKRAPVLFLESLQDTGCRFKSHACIGGREFFLKNQCAPAGRRQGEMGYRSRNSLGRGMQLLRTRATAPYCQQ